MSPSENERDLQLATSGDRDAIARLLIAHSPRLARRIGTHLRMNPFAGFSIDDVLQELYIDAFRGIRLFRGGDEAQFAAWLNRLADSRLATMLRERGRMKRGGKFRRMAGGQQDSRTSRIDLVQQLSDRDGVTASQLANSKEVVIAVNVGLATLPEEQREAIKLHYLEQRSLKSTASAMQKTDGAVRGLLHRAKRSMRDVLGRSTRWFCG